MNAYPNYFPTASSSDPSKSRSRGFGRKLADAAVQYAIVLMCGLTVTIFSLWLFSDPFIRNVGAKYVFTAIQLLTTFMAGIAASWYLNTLRAAKQASKQAHALLSKELFALANGLDAEKVDVIVQELMKIKLATKVSSAVMTQAILEAERAVAVHRVSAEDQALFRHQPTQEVEDNQTMWSQQKKGAASATLCGNLG